MFSFPTSAEAAYGLGWGVYAYKGAQVIGHGGGNMGFATLLNFLPEKKLGVVMIANGTGRHQAKYFIWKQLMKFWFEETVQVDRLLAYQLEEEKKNHDEFVANLSTPAKKWMSHFPRFMNDRISNENGIARVLLDSEGENPIEEMTSTDFTC